MDANIYIGCIVLILLVIASVWIVRSYFNNNIQQSSNQKGKFVENNFKNDAASETVTESNNELGRKPFDGINRNPNHYDKSHIKLNGGKLPDIANESVKNQPEDRRL